MVFIGSKSWIQFQRSFFFSVFGWKMKYSLYSIFAVFLYIFRLSSILTEKISFFSAEKRYVYFFQSDLLCK